MRATLITGSLLLATTVLLAGCGRGVPVTDGLAGPVTGPSATASASAAASAAAGTPPLASPSARTSTKPVAPPPPPPARTSTKPVAPPTRPPSRPATPKPPASPLTLGPDGFGALKIGMTRQAATASGTVKAWKNGRYVASCLEAGLVGSAPSPEFGYVQTGQNGKVAAIWADRRMRTPEGVGIGTPWSRVQRIYPSVAGTRIENLGQNLTVVRVPVPGNAAATYRFSIGRDQVIHLTLENGQRCYETGTL